MFQYEKNAEFDGLFSIDEATTVDLFEARCYDKDEVHHANMKKALEHFKIYIFTHSRHGKLIIKNMQLGIHAAKVISKLLTKLTFS